VLEPSALDPDIFLKVWSCYSFSRSEKGVAVSPVNSTARSRLSLQAVLICRDEPLDPFPARTVFPITQYELRYRPVTQSGHRGDDAHSTFRRRSPPPQMPPGDTFFNGMRASAQRFWPRADSSPGRVDLFFAASLLSKNWDFEGFRLFPQHASRCPLYLSHF